MTDKRTIVATAFSPGDDPTNVVVWVSDAGRLRAAREALRELRKAFPSLEELALEEGDGVGVRASFGDVDLTSLVEAEGDDAEEVFNDNHWVDLQDPDAPVAELQETVDENFGSVRVRVQDDCFYVTAMMEDTPIESVKIPY